MKSKWKIPLRVLAMAGASTAFWGCTVASEGDATEASGMFDEVAFHTPEAGSAAPEGPEDQKAVSYTIFMVDAMQPNVSVSVGSTGKLCVLSEIWGDTHGWGTANDDRGFKIRHSAKDTWSVLVNSLPAHVAGTCVNRSAFRMPSGGTVELSTEPARAFTNMGASTSELFGWGDSAAFVGGLWSGPGEILMFPFTLDGGGFEGMGEMVRVDQAPLVSFPHVLNADVGHAGSVIGYAHWIRAGIPGAAKPMFWGYKDGSMVRARYGAAGTSFTMSISTFNGYSGFWMAQTSDAICVMTRYQGRLGGTDAHVQAYQHGTQWKSNIKSAYEAEASYRCVAYDQR